MPYPITRPVTISPHPSSLPPPPKSDPEDVRMTAKNCPPAVKNHLLAKRHPTLSPRQLALIWEVYARIGLRPEQAVHLLRRQRQHVTPSQAKDQISHARRRNLLRLVFPARMS